MPLITAAAPADVQPVVSAPIDRGVTSLTLDEELQVELGLLEDVAGAAEAQGRPIDEAYERLSWQTEWMVAATTLFEELGQSITQLAIVGERSPRHVRVGIPGQVPDPSVVEILAPLALDVEYVTMTGVSFTELNARLTTLAAAMATRGVPREVESGVEGRLLLRVLHDDLAVAQNVVRELSLPNVDIIAVSELNGTTLDARHGGAVLTSSNSSTTVRCTTAFNGTWNGTGGVYTAGHCNDYPYWHKNWNRFFTGGDASSTTQLVSAHNSQGDIAFRSTPDLESDRFYYKLGDNQRFVDNVGTPTQGASVYGFGQRPSTDRGYTTVSCYPCAFGRMTNAAITARAFLEVHWF